MQQPTVENVMDAMDATDDRDEFLAELLSVLTQARMMGVTRDELIAHVEKTLG